MTSRNARAVYALLSGLLLAPWVPARQAASAVTPEQAALAERFSQIAGTVGVNPDAPAYAVDMASNLIDAANRLNPGEKRFVREAIDVALRRGDRDKAIAMLAAYRKLDPDDQLAQVQAIDLYVDRIQTAEGRAEYLQKVVGVQGVPAAVRSHAAARAAGVLRDRGQAAAAEEMLTQALKLNPLNPQALQTRYEDAIAHGTPVDRVKCLAALLTSNPAQPAVMSALAQELMSAGLFDDAQQWYGRSISISQQTGNVPSGPDLLNYAAALLQTGETRGASSAAAAILKSDPTAAAAFQLKLLADKPSAEDYPKTLLAARQAATLRLNLGAALADLPADAKLPEIAPDAALIDVRTAAKNIVSRKRDDLSAAFAGALADLIWLDVYYDKKPAPGERLEALQVLLGAEHPVVVRLTGWNAAANNNPGEAKVKLSAIAARDPLARLGEILQTAKDAPEQAKTDAVTLAAQHPLGTTGALLRAAAAQLQAPLVPRPDGSEMHAALAAVPVGLLDIFQNARAFYGLRAEPLRIAHAYGQPMLVEVTLTNTGDFPLTLGPDGVIASGVTIDASIKGLVTQYVPAVATARLTGKLVLQRSESVSAVVRVNQGPFENFLSANPQPAVTIFVSALTNPLAAPNTIVAGPGGYRAQASRVIERSALPLASPEARKALFERLPTLGGDTRLRTMELVATLARTLRSAGIGSPEAQAVFDSFTVVLDAARKGDPAVEVRAMASYAGTTLLEGTARRERVKEMLAAPDWSIRAIGVLAALPTPIAERAALLAPVAAGDADELVKRLAATATEIPDPPATQPATAPATPPATP